jgi:uncharacterized protein (TIGR03083 family)
VAWGCDAGPVAPRRDKLSAMDAFAPIAAQRRALVKVLDGLTEEQWRTQSLCEAWTVHDLTAHLVLPFETTMPRFAVAMVKALGNFDNASVALTAKVARAPSAELVAKLRENAASHFTPPGQDWHAPLTDTYVHTQDICVPLGVEAPADPEQWPVILDFLMSKKARGAFVGRPLPGVRLTATDVRWSAGEGPEASGAAAALVMTLLGRTALADQLQGPGAATLAAWAAGS